MALFLVVALSMSNAAGAQTASRADISLRDQLIFNQESLLNTYRCLFAIDTQIVPGGCQNKVSAKLASQPESFAGMATASEVSARDQLIAAQETLLNAYRCLFGVDTQIVPGGCQNGTPGVQPEGGSQPVGQVLAADQIYKRLTPSIPRITSGSGAGSGLLLEGGYVLTSFHLVWPHEVARVVFLDGTVFEEVPVVAYDFMADVALLGPVAFDAPPLPLVFPFEEGMSPGSDLFLIGYPGELGQFPQPSITRGILNRFRQWDTYDLTLIQTDAAIAGGQSGGALVNNRGQVVGISNWSFSEAGFGLAVSASNIADILRELLESVASVNSDYDRGVSGSHGEFSFEVDTTRHQAFAFTGTAGAEVTITIDGPADGVIAITGSAGVLAIADETDTGKETLVFQLLEDGRYFVVVDSFSNQVEGYDFDLTSSVPLQPYEDPDDGTDTVGMDGWSVGSKTTLFGLFDYHYDIDVYRLFLNEGEVYSVSTDSVLVDTVVTIVSPVGDEFYNDDSGQVTVLNNSLNSLIEFTAQSTGEHIVRVHEYLDRSGGGYALIVERLE